jgi:site-specific DNA-methyltransferase (adenine-specific)
MEIDRLVNSIIVGDSRTVLKIIPDNSIDLVITSPPYNFGREYRETTDSMGWDEYFDLLFCVWRECYRILKPDGRIAIVIQPKFSDYVPTHHIVWKQLTDIGFHWMAEILWDKSNYHSAPTTWGSWCSPSLPYFRYTWEFIEVFWKARPKKEGKKEYADVEPEEFQQAVRAKWNIAPEKRMREFSHPAMFPEEIPGRLMRILTYKYDVVVDPFNGAGTTTVTAWRLRRRFIGVDISKEYCETAFQRVVSESQRLSLLDMLEENDRESPFYPSPRLVTDISCLLTPSPEGVCSEEAPDSPCSISTNQ